MSGNEKGQAHKIFLATPDNGLEMDNISLLHDRETI